MQQDLLQDYFWRCVLTSRFSSAAETKLTQDVKQIDKILNDEQPVYDVPIDVSAEFIRNHGYFSAGSAFIKGMLCLLAYQQPVSFQNNGIVHIANDWLKQANSKNYHHFFPKAYMRKVHPEVEDWLVNHIGNITIVDDFLNKRSIRDRAPSKYISEYMAKNSNLEKALNSHLISTVSGWGVLEDDYPTFFQNRLNWFSKELKGRVIVTQADGYKLENGQLFINEEEAAAIRVIFDQYVHTDMGANGLAKYLDQHGIHKIQRQNGKNPLFDAALIRRILKNPVYCGKIAYGRRRTEKVHGTRNDYRLVEQDDYLLVDGQHEGIVSEELWHEAQVKLLAQAEKYEHVNRGKDTKVHLLSGIVKCPICGAGMYGNKSIKHKSDGTKYKDFFYYGCKHRTMTRGHKCDYRKQIHEELLDSAVAEVIVKLVSNPKFAAMMQEKINMKVDTAAIEQEIANYEKQLRQSYSVKLKLMEEIDSLDPDDKHYYKRKADLDDRLYKMYDKIENTENLLIAARAKKMAIEAEKLTGDNIYKVLIYFDKLYAVMSEQEKRQIMEALISEIQIYEERQPNGQWLKSIKFKLPIIEEDMSLSLDNDTQVETVVLLSRETNPLTVEVRMEVETGEVKEHPTYKRIQEYVQEKYGFKVHTAYIAEVKRMVGLDMHKAPNAVEQRKHEYHPCPPEKVEAIKDALRHFGLISE